MKRIFTPLLALICFTCTLRAQTQVSGYILSNTTWTTANSPYIVTGNTLVINGITLTIQPGVVVKFDSTKALQIDGELIARGTVQNRITFTATDTTPAKGSWGRIQFHNSSVDAVLDTAGNYISGSILNYCDILYGGGIGSSGAVHCDTSAPYFSHIRISESKTAGIYFNYSSNRGIDSSSIRNCTADALFYNHPSSPDLIIRDDTVQNTRGINAYAGTNTSNSYNYSFNNAEFYNNRFISNALSYTSEYLGVIGLCVPRCVISNNVFASNSLLTYNDNGGIINLIRTNYWEISGNTFTSNTVVDSWGSTLLFGGVIAIYNSGSATGFIRNNVFISNNANTASTYAAVIYATGEISHNYFEGNTNVLVSFSPATVLKCNRFFQNLSSNGHSMLDFLGICESNVFDSNTADLHTSIINLNISDFTNNLLINNSAPNGSIISTGYSAVPANHIDIHSNDFVNNSGLNTLKINGLFTFNIFQNNFSNPGVQYEMNNSRLFGTPNVDADSNYWGGRNTAQIDSVIRDFFDDGTLSVVVYPPALSSSVVIDTTCHATTCNLTVTGTVVAVSCYGGSNGSINVSVANGTSPYIYSWNSGTNAEDRNALTSGSYAVTVVDALGCSATKGFVVTQPASPVAVVSAVVSDANCNAGGAINITATGGTGPYTYSWGNSITTEDRTGLNPGNYSVTVRDNYQCFTTRSFTVGQSAGPVVSGAVTNASCYNGCNGAINLSVTGLAPFTFDWGGGFGTTEDTSGLCPGIYSVIVADSNNCGIGAAFTITAPPQLFAAAGVASDVSCYGYNNGIAVAAAAGGTAPYNFVWSNGQTTDTATALTAGVYAVTVTDSLGCMAVATTPMADGFLVYVGVIVGLNSATLNEHTTYSVNANAAYTYQWNVTNGLIISGQGTNGIEVAWTAAGTGTIQLITLAQGCGDTVYKSVTITDTIQNCSALFYLYPDTFPHAYFVVNTASGSSQLSYQWNWGDGSPLDTIAYPAHTYSTAGFYSICLTISDSSGCTDTYCNPYFLLKTDGELAMIQVNVYPPTFTGIPNSLPDDIEVYPNPTANTFTITATTIREQVTLLLFDALGKEVLHQTAQPQELSNGLMIDMRLMHEGIYFLSIRGAGGNRMIKVVKY